MGQLETDNRREAETQAALATIRILDTEQEKEFDRIVAMAVSIFQVPMAAIAFLAGERIWFKARAGIAVAEVSAAHSLCSLAAQQDEPFIINNTADDPRCPEPPLVAPNQPLRFYAGVCLHGRGQRIGTLCLMDTQARSFDADQADLLCQLGAIVEDLLASKETEAALRNSEVHLRAIIETEPECVKVISAEGMLIDINAAGLQILEAETLGQVLGKPVIDLIHPDDRTLYSNLHQQALAGNSHKAEFRMSGLAGTERWMDSHAVPLRSARGHIDSVLSLTRDVSQSKRETAFRALEARVLELVSANTSLHGILAEVTQTVDRLLPDFRSSILLVLEGKLRHGSAPQLPAAWNAVIDGLSIGPNAGACGTAAWRKQAVFVSDTGTDPLFEPWRDFAVQHGLRACWSMPVLNAANEVLATCSLYSGTVRLPLPWQLDLLQRISRFILAAIERTRQYESLQQSESRYRSLFNLVPVSIWEEDWSALLPLLHQFRTTSEAGLLRYYSENPQQLQQAFMSIRFLDLNQATLDIYEADSREEIIAAMATVFDSPDSLPSFISEMKSWARGNTTHVAEMRQRTAKGRMIHVLMSLYFPPPDSNSGRVMVSVMDITARKQAEVRFQVVAQYSSDVVWDWNLVDNLIWWSEGMQRVFGYHASQIDPREEFWIERIHPEDQQRVLDSVVLATSSTAGHWTCEYRFRKVDGRYAWVSDQGAILRNEAGKANRMIGSMKDVTKQRHLEEQLRQAQRLDAIGQLTGGIAHDFNNLLTVILGNAETLTECLAGDRNLRMLAELTTKAALRGAELTKHLLAFARRQPLEPKVVDINQLIEQMDKLLERALGEHVEITLVRSPDLHQAMVDPGQLENALLNLCINARDAMPQGGRLTIETANCRLDGDFAGMQGDVNPGNYVMVAVSDTGCGMDADTLAQAFEPFFTTKDVGKGSGLGLSMVYGFIRQSSGHIRIYSEVGVGTVVRFYLPCALTDSKQQDDRGDTALAKGSERILLVEDDELVRDFTYSMLLNLGYQVVATSNGQQAIEILQDAQFDLLLTDIVMPGGISGRQLADRVREQFPHMPVLYTSGYTEDALMQHGRLESGVVLLQKPFRKQELAEKLRQVLQP